MGRRKDFTEASLRGPGRKSKKQQEPSAFGDVTASKGKSVYCIAGVWFTIYFFS